MIIENAISIKAQRWPKETWIGWFASLMEAYNMAIYSFIAPFIGTMLFRQEMEKNALLFSYILVLVGAGLLYPVGAIYYGFLGDREGRQRTCTRATLGLAVATGLMGVMPLNFLGDYAWICFLLCICTQYFFSGGEYHGSIVFSLEHTQGQQNGLVSSLSCLFAVFGIAIANGLATLVQFVESAAWVRCCFLLGGIGGVVSYILKNYCQETPAFSSVLHHTYEKMSLWSFVRKEKYQICAVTFVIAFYLVIYFYIFMFLPLVDANQISGSAFDTFKSLLIYGVFLVLSGYLADRFGTNKVMLIGTGSLSLLLLPASYFIHNLFFLQALLTICACLFIGPIHGWMLKQFEVRERCRGIFISSALATSIFGGSTLPICLLLHDAYSSLVVCSLYPLTLALVACGFLGRNGLTGLIGQTGQKVSSSSN